MIGLLHEQLEISSTFWDADRILVAIAILVSVFGLFYSMYFNRKTFRLTEGHNKLSVKPIVNITVNFFKPRTFSIILKNKGFGPAIISSVNFYYNDLVYDNFQTLYDNNLKQHGTDEFENHHNLVVQNIGSALISGEEDKILELTLDDNTKLDKLRELYEGVTIKVVYNDIYNNEYIEY